MEEYIVKDGRKLRLGYTTGTCAAAAAKAAAWMLLTGQRKEKIGIDTPKGIHLDLVVREITIGGNKVSCAIEKDSGDDPDITKGVLVFATVSLTGGPAIRIDGGKGVGRVTGKGLDQPVGAAAINSVPRQMIRENLEEVCETLDYQGGLDVVISVPGGEELAKKTFNPRLGIEGGISILGTTGIVDPMSDRALVETIRLELRQRRENGAEYVLLTPGNYGADFVKTELALPPSFAVLSSNFIGDSIDICGELGFRGPNVTMGYALCREDLAKGDEFCGEYHTGDIAKRDTDGFYYIVGRKGRFLKLFGLRVSLDETERILKMHYPGTDFVCTGDDKQMRIFTTKEELKDQIIPFISGKTNLHNSAFRVILLDEIPYNEYGKVRFEELELSTVPRQNS